MHSEALSQQPSDGVDNRKEPNVVVELIKTFESVLARIAAPFFGPLSMLLFWVVYVTVPGGLDAYFDGPSLVAINSFCDNLLLRFGVVWAVMLPLHLSASVAKECPTLLRLAIVPLMAAFLISFYAQILTTSKPIPERFMAVSARVTGAYDHFVDQTAKEAARLYVEMGKHDQVVASDKKQEESNGND